MAQEEHHKDNWLDRKTFKCGTCIWYTQKEGKIGRCKRHAPTMDGFPVVYETDYCGDHKLDHTKVIHPLIKEMDGFKVPPEVAKRIRDVMEKVHDRNAERIIEQAIKVSKGEAPVAPDSIEEKVADHLRSAVERCHKTGAPFCNTCDAPIDREMDSKKEFMENLVKSIEKDLNLPEGTTVKVVEIGV